MQQLAHKWDAQLYNNKHSFVYDFGASLIELLDPKPEERILDLGCGSGELTHKIKELSQAVVGMDKSVEMIQRAQTQFPFIDFVVGDASDFHFEQGFDAIFSNAALHWVIQYKQAIRCMYEGLKEGGRMVVEFGGKDNVKTIVGQLRQSLLKRGFVKQSELELWYFPSIGEYTLALEAVGFKVSFAQWYDRPTALADGATGIKDWLVMFCKPFLEGVDDASVFEIMNEVQASLKPKLFKNGKWYADYKRIRIVAYR
ncbi:MAG: methyltransferase domain-containing protein [Maribacter sp.]|uniref:methyltransferase domain-containing protein n=1 Tax=Maribacter sp. TaxID=1897614 RepID=UPI0032985FE9